MKNEVAREQSEIETCIDRKISEKYLKNQPGFGNDGEIDVMEPEKTIDETYSKRHSDIQYFATAIDIDNSEWNRKYASRMEKNLERFKELGLYRRLQEIGILYDEEQFKRTYSVIQDENGRQTQMNIGKGGSYDEIESQFDDIEKKIEDVEKKNKSEKSE